MRKRFKSINMGKLNYKELDSNIVNLVRALNAFPGVVTIGSCGGHPDPGPGQWPEGRWYVKMEFEKNEAGWIALEFLAWAINVDYASEYHAFFYPTSAPPYLNRPGKMLAFALEGRDVEPDDLAEFLDTVREECFIGA